MRKETMEVGRAALRPQGTLQPMQKQEKKKHQTERILDSSPIARNIRPGQWGVLRPEFPIRGVPTSVPLSCSVTSWEQTEENSLREQVQRDYRGHLHSASDKNVTVFNFVCTESAPNCLYAS